MLPLIGLAFLLIPALLGSALTTALGIGVLIASPLVAIPAVRHHSGNHNCVLADSHHPGGPTRDDDLGRLPERAAALELAADGSRSRPGDGGRVSAASAGTMGGGAADISEDGFRQFAGPSVGRLFGFGAPNSTETLMGWPWGWGYRRLQMPTCSAIEAGREPMSTAGGPTWMVGGTVFGMWLGL